MNPRECAERIDPWSLYRTLIEGVPDGPCVRDYCLGTHWSYVEADCGMGVSFTCRGGARGCEARDLRGLPLREAARLSMSWRFEASASKNVVVVGHFPHAERIAEYANLTVLERNCAHDLDTPDPACEYVLPDADFAFFTGVTLINKTAPRLLELASSAETVLVGPSVVMSPTLFEHGADVLAGSVVADPEKVRFAVKNGAGRFFGEALAMASLSHL